MKHEKLMVFLTMLFLLILSAGIAAASENTTDELGDGEEYNSVIVADDISHEYRTGMGNEITFKLEDLSGNPIRDESPQVTYDNKKVRAFWDDENHYGQGWGTYVLDVEPQAGNHKVTIELNTTKHLAKPVLIDVNFTQMATKLTLKKYVTTTKEYAVLKAIVKDKNNAKVCEGKVKFKIDGKTYTVSVKNGVATKKIKLKKAKTYTYTATFTSKNYKTKTASSKVYIKKAKNYYTIKIRNQAIKKTFTVKMSYKKYLRVLNAKNNGKYGYADVDTGIKRPPEWGGGHYCVGLSTNDEYFTYYGYDLGDYIFLRASSYLQIKKVNLYSSNF